MINEFDSPQSEMSSMANANAYGDKTAQTNKDPQTSNNDAPPNNPFTTWQHVPTKNGDKLSVYQAGDYYFSIQANNGEYKYSYVSKKNLPPNILPDDLFNYAKVKSGSWKPLADPQKLGAPARYDVSKTKDPLKSLRPTLGYSWNGGNTSTTPQLNNGDKSAKLPSTNIPIDRSISPDVESSWLTQLSNAASVVLDIGVELIDLSPLGDLSRIIIGTDVRGNPVTLEERLITMGCLLIPGSKYAVKAVDAAVTIAKKGGDVAKTMVKKGSATVKKLANDVDKFVDEMGAYTKSPSPFPPLMPEFASGADFDQWAKKQFSQEATNTKAAKSTTQHNFKKTETSSSTPTTKKTELTTKEDIKGNSEMGEPQKPTLKTTNTSSKKTETSTPTTNTPVPTTKKTEPRIKKDIKGDLDKIRKELNDNGGKLSEEMEAKINKLLDELNSHTNLAAQQAANLQERLRGLLNIVGLSLKTTMRIERLLEQLQGINAPATPQEQTTSPQLPATPLEANFKDLTLDERIKELQQHKKDGTITHVEEQELGNLEFAAQQNNADELRKRIEEIEKDASIEPAEKERVLKLLREKLAGVLQSNKNTMPTIEVNPAHQLSETDLAIIQEFAASYNFEKEISKILGYDNITNISGLAKLFGSVDSKIKAQGLGSSAANKVLADIQDLLDDFSELIDRKVSITLHPSGKINSAEGLADYKKAKKQKQADAQKALSKNVPKKSGVVDVGIVPSIEEINAMHQDHERNPYNRQSRDSMDVFQFDTSELTKLKGIQAEDLPRIEDLVEQTVKKAQNIITQRKSEDGPVLAGCIDLSIPNAPIHWGQNFINAGNKENAGSNFGAYEAFIKNMHPILQKRYALYLKHEIKNNDQALLKAGLPGSHAEIVALDKALKARDAYYQQQGSKRRVTESDLNEFVIHNRNIDYKSDLGKDSLPTVPPRCINCYYLTDGVIVVGND